MTTSTENQIEKYCVFRQGSSLFALPANCVVEVSPNPVMVAMPDSNPVLAGVAHLRNEFLPVLELRALMDVEAHQGSLERQLLVVNGTHGPWAVLVDRVMGLESLEISNNQDLPNADDWTSAVIGAAALHNEVTRVLNPRILYRLAENVLQQSWANSDNDRLAV